MNRILEGRQLEDKRLKKLYDNEKLEENKQQQDLHIDTDNKKDILSKHLEKTGGVFMGIGDLMGSIFDDESSQNFDIIDLQQNQVYDQGKEVYLNQINDLEHVNIKNQYENQNEIAQEQLTILQKANLNEQESLQQQFQSIQNKDIDNLQNQAEDQRQLEKVNLKSQQILEDQYKEINTHTILDNKGLIDNAGQTVFQINTILQNTDSKQIQHSNQNLQPDKDFQLQGINNSQSNQQSSVFMNFMKYQDISTQIQFYCSDIPDSLKIPSIEVNSQKQNQIPISPPQSKLDKNKIIERETLFQTINITDNSDPEIQNMSTYELSQQYNQFLQISELEHEGIQSKFQQVKYMLQMFGIPYVEAPSEAEAQCAKLEELGLIDGIITEDSDVFLFGGKKIYRGVFESKNYVQYYNIKKIHEIIGVDRNKLILLALFLGSDYTIGIKGVGQFFFIQLYTRIVNSMEIVEAFHDLDALKRFRQWAQQSDLLLEDLSQHYKNISENELKYKQKHKKYKNSWEMPNDFPSQLVVDAYLQPFVDDTEEKFVWTKPNIEIIKQFCKQEFQWSDEYIDEITGILNKVLQNFNMKQPKITNYFQKTENLAQINSSRIKNAIYGLKKTSGQFQPQNENQDSNLINEESDDSQIDQHILDIIRNNKAKSSKIQDKSDKSKNSDLSQDLEEFFHKKVSKTLKKK